MENGVGWGEEESKGEVRTNEMVFAPFFYFSLHTEYCITVY